MKSYFLFAFLLCIPLKDSVAQRYFNAWLTTCSHLIGPTGDPASLKQAVDQSRGLDPEAPGFAWDVLIDLGDWTASQQPPGDKEGRMLSDCLNEALGKDRGRFLTLAGNHDGDPKGWMPGTFARKYVNPLGESDFLTTSGYSAEQREEFTVVCRVLDYPGMRWDRYLVRTGNLIWIMLSDRNEFDELAVSRGDSSGQFQAGRGSASGMPDGGYPSGSVTLSTFNWWKKVVEDPSFRDDILITAHHLLPANTTIATTAGNQTHFHGRSGSVGPEGQIAGQLYWIREYDSDGEEIMQYAQTRPFLNYLRDHPGVIAAWIGGHTHVDFPEQMLDYRGIYVRKYGVTFLSVGALTKTHGGGDNQMSRLLTFEEDRDEAMVNVYIHRSTTDISSGWYSPAARKFPLGKKFVCPVSSSDVVAPSRDEHCLPVPDAPPELFAPRYAWDLDANHDHDFNNATHVIGQDGSPYGRYQGRHEIVYSEETPAMEGRSLDFRENDGRVVFDAPYQPEMNWERLTLSLWLKTSSTEPQEVVSYSPGEGTGKFRLWYDGSAWTWDVGTGTAWSSARWKSQSINNGQDWHHIFTIADAERNRIQLWVDGRLVAEETWTGKSLQPCNHRFAIGASGDSTGDAEIITWKRPFNGFIDEVRVFDAVIYPAGW
jgi:hypothetical protein